MNNQLQKNLIETIREKVPSEKNLATYLADKLSLGRESVYRRLRGEIYFTFDEIAALSLDLGFSIDHIIGTKKNENALFNIHMLNNLAHHDISMYKISEYGRTFREMGDQSTIKARMATNTLPYYFLINHENLSRFRIYKWLHQNQRIGTNDKFADFKLSEEMLEAQKTFSQDIQKVPDFTIIMDNNIFWSAAKDIEYFAKRGLLNEEDLHVLKKELSDIVDRLEKISTEGVSESGSRITIYISSVDLEASYLHFESGNKQFAQVRVFSISAIDSYDERLCTIQKEWIDSLKKYSVLISRSGEIQRFEYMNRQRGYVNKVPFLDS